MLSTLLAGLWLMLAHSALGATLYVNLANPTPASPYASWASAATCIQDAVDAAVAGDLILVTNGMYSTGARHVNGMSNRVAVTKPVTVQSVNGPRATVIKGYQMPGTTNGTAAIRCVYLTNGAVLSGFTLTNGATDTYIAGGGVFCESTAAVLTNCTLTGNSACNGGGASYGTLKNCILSGNTAANSGGGTYSGTLNNCTLSGNSAEYGGGANSSTLNNCILYYNTAARSGDNYDSGILSYCCTTPLPSGTGNITNAPLLASASHLSAASPCRRSGRSTYASGLDIDGEFWTSPPSIGCDEYWSGAVTGAVNVAILASHTNVATGFAIAFQVQIDGKVSASRWDFGDGITVSNQPCISHAWTTPGDYTVELRAWNETYTSGVAATITIHVVSPPVHYVSIHSASPVPPYATWATAATNIQDAVDASVVPGAVVLVSNGVYETVARRAGGTSNRVAVTKPVNVQSVNGPGSTAIKGYQVPRIIYGTTAIRCVYLANRAVLSGFTLTNGATQTASSGTGVWCEGGGVFCESTAAVLTNCTLSGNMADSGGGASNGDLLRLA